ncbi:hypothetical protein Tco_0263340 [Tanacetum coccineum]
MVGTKFSTLYFISSSDSVSRIVSRCSSPILRESSGFTVDKTGVIAIVYWKRIFKKRTKTKPKRQNRARECEEREKSKSTEVKVKKSTKEKSKVKPEAKTEEILNGSGQPIKGFIEDQMGLKGPKPF